MWKPNMQNRKKGETPRIDVEVLGSLVQALKPLQLPPRPQSLRSEVFNLKIGAALAGLAQ